MKVKQGHFEVNGSPYYYVGANYWYGAVLANDVAGRERVRHELDFLKANGVTNLRILGGAEGEGFINGVPRVEPALQPAAGMFNVDLLKGLDFLLSEMGKRDMKAVIFLSNNWEWSGGFMQYLNWNGLLPDSILRRKLGWDEMRDYVSRFYSCEKCIAGYEAQVRKIVGRTNTITHITYANDPAIMAWEIANEPRPMRPAAISSFKAFIRRAARFIKAIDNRHLVTAGNEGEMGSEDLLTFQAIHALEEIDYATIHIWPKNWSWFRDTSIAASFTTIQQKTADYITKHVSVARDLKKPLVVEEFGLPRDGHSYATTSTTLFRDRYYAGIFDQLVRHARDRDVIAGANFWTFSGQGRPSYRQLLWKKGDDLLGDPPVEEQGLNSVFDSDSSTWQMTRSYVSQLRSLDSRVHFAESDHPADKQATRETVQLFRNLKRISLKGYLFGHQDDLAYGVGWKYRPGRSDVKEVAGDYPALYGWDLGGIERTSSKINLDSVPFDKMKQFIRAAYRRGGVVTISWHADSPLGEGRSAWDTSRATVPAILPGGEKNAFYNGWLDKLAAFFHSLKGDHGEAIPVLFRPFHEHTGGWFWWGNGNCNDSNYISLWRYTVNYLQDQKKVHNLLWVYNTGGDFATASAYLERYPGDDMVDVLSFDSYQHGDPSTDNRFTEEIHQKLAILEAEAGRRNKLFALAETGYEAIPYEKWWTQTLAKAIGNHRIAWVLVWRNHGYHTGMKKMHYYTPFKGQVSAADFRAFYGMPQTLFEKELKNEKVYR